MRRFLADTNVRTGIAVFVGYAVAEQLFLPDLGEPGGLILAAFLGTVTGLTVGAIRAIIDR